MYVYKITKNKYTYFDTVESIDIDNEYDVQEYIMMILRKQRETKNINKIYIKDLGICRIYHFQKPFAYAVSKYKLNDSGKVKE